VLRLWTAERNGDGVRLEGEAEPAAPLPNGATRLSSHGIGVGEAVELARALGQPPERCVVYAIEIGWLEMGAPLSPAVAAAAAGVAERLQAEIAGRTSGFSGRRAPGGCRGSAP